QSSRTGTATPARPNVPATTPCTTLPNVPWMPHHSRAATTTARPMRKNATPSRRCAGSSSLAPFPMVRTSAPTPCAAPSQTARTARTGHGGPDAGRRAGRRVPEEVDRPRPVPARDVPRAEDEPPRAEVRGAGVRLLAVRRACGDVRVAIVVLTYLRGTTR